MAHLSASQFVELIRKSRLLGDDQLRAVQQQISTGPDAPRAADADWLAAELERRGLLTAWQAQKLLSGRYKGFFLGKYMLLDFLGSGGMSSVYLATHIRMNRQVAIKILPKHLVKDAAYLQRFYLEAQAVAALDHPNIVRAYDVDCSDGIHYLVMEYAPGRDLKTLIQQAGQPLPLQDVASWIAQAARGLQHAHDSGLIHRDVKPANLLVDDRGHVKLLDLGLARFQQQHEDGSLTLAYQQHVLGTADYLAPEQALNSHAVDARADIYSLGCTLYFAVSGRPPFEEGTLAQRLASHQSREPAPLNDLRPDCDPQLAAICHKMMRKHPDDRYPSADAVAEALSVWRAEANTYREPVGSVVEAVTESTPTSPDITASSVEDFRALLPVEEAEPLLARRQRKLVTKKPPWTLWICLGLLSTVALGLAVYVVLLRG